VAAELGDAWAQNQVETFYWHGIGPKPDREAGIRWFRRSANQGNAGAQRNLREALKSQ
jgi:uncharacterized protein